MAERISILSQKAEPVVSVLTGFSSVKGVLCFGSYAQGTADAYSDVDLYVVCQPEIPPCDDRELAFSGLVGMEAVEIGHQEAGWETSWCPQNDRLLLASQSFDVTYNTQVFIESVVQAVRRGEVSTPEMPFRPYTLLGMLAEAVPLYDWDGALRELRAGLYPYPQLLKQRLLTQNLALARSAVAELQDYARRGIGGTAFHFHQGRAFDALGGLLFALNERYDPASKRVELVLDRLPKLPQDFSHRYRSLVETPLTPRGMEKIANDLELLLGEIEALILAGEVE